MKEFISTMYVTLLLPITMGYIEKYKKDTGKLYLYPLAFLILILVISGYTGSEINSNKIEMLLFNLRKWFK